MVTGAAYQLPTAPGYSAQMFDTSVAHYRFPDGPYWSSRTDLFPTNHATAAHAPALTTAS